MNSAAKLRNRVIALAGATAIVMTSFGPAAMAWTGPNPGAATDPNAASIGVIDADDATPGTQGAQAVAPGASNQPIADVRFVLPSTWVKGDTVTFTLGDGANLTGTTADKIAKRISFSSLPAVSIDKTAYADTTFVASASPATGAPAGSVEAGKEQKYTGAGTPVAPDFTAELTSTGTDQLNNQITLTFNNSSDPLVDGAKFIGAINGAKVNLGSAVPAGKDLGLTAATSGTALEWWSDATGADGTQATTYPATIVNSSLEVSNGSVVSDGTMQFVGPVTVTSPNLTATKTVAFQANGGAFEKPGNITATFYDSTGKVVGTPAAGNASVTTTDTANDTVSAVVPAGGAVKVVFTGMAMATSAQSVTYTLTQDGTGSGLPTGKLGATTGNNVAVATLNAGTNRNQVDIDRPEQLSKVNATSTALPDRIGGQDRYQTAVKIAERALGTNPKDGVRGESDNVVIASGEGFADALSAGYLAATKKAQLILTRAGSLPQTDVEFLKTYGAKNVFIVGGTGSVSKTVEDQLRAMTSYDVQAADNAVMPGPDGKAYRVAFSGVPAGVTLEGNPVSGQATDPKLPTSVNLVITRDAQESSPTDNTTKPGNNVSSVTLDGDLADTLVANDDDTATATFKVGTGTLTVKISATAGTAGSSSTTALTTTTSTVDVPTTQPIPAELATGSNRKVVPLSSNLTVTRLAGSDRYETNRKVNEYAGATSVNPIGTTVPEYGKPGKKTAILVNGSAPWDALAAGPLVGKNGGATRYPLPIVLTSGSTLNGNAKAQMQSLDVAAALMVGGAGVLPDSLMGEMNNLGVYSLRLADKKYEDRWGTAKAVAEFALRSDTPSADNKFPGLNFSKHNPILANGGSLAGKTGGVAKGAWADALAAGPYAAANGFVITLTDSRKMPDATMDLYTANKTKLGSPVVTVGLGDVVSTEVVDAANKALAK